MLLVLINLKKFAKVFVALCFLLLGISPKRLGIICKKNKVHLHMATLPERHMTIFKNGMCSRKTLPTPCRLVFKLPEQVLLHATSYVIFLTFSAVGMTSGPTGNRVC